MKFYIKSATYKKHSNRYDVKNAPIRDSNYLFAQKVCKEHPELMRRLKEN